MIEVIHGAGSALIALLFLIPIGNAVCASLLASTGLQKAREDLLTAAQPPITSPEGVGAWIGGFERTLVAAGLMTQAWEVLAAVIALKTVARFKEIDQRIHAEYFLIGSLFSLVWAFAVTLCWQLYDASWGVGMSAWLFPTAAN